MKSLTMQAKMRESLAIALIKLLKGKGAVIEYSDPHVPAYESCKMKSIEIPPGNIQKYDLLLLVTEHDKFNFKMIHNNGQIVVDTRGI